MPAAHITTRVDGHVLHIGVDRPEKRNAFDRGMLHALAEAYDRLATDDDLRVGVVSARGDHFSAGLDLADVGPAIAAGEPFVPEGMTDPFGIWGEPCPKPVVMAVQGVAFTLTIELALAADIIVAADDVRFRQLEIGRGIVPFGGATIRAVRNLGWGNAMKFLLTGEEFGAEEAHRIGLVQEVVPAGEQLAAATAIAETIAKQAPLGVQATLRQSRLSRDVSTDAAIADMHASLVPIMTSEDAAEGLRSFVERRDGVYQGK
ncbi:Enoyl-CoA hydratase [Euzebya pacifica]|uniref:Enoyl-CoA hydratase n=1 Tax=Euzebya pacifica TaxID=1608957 RepID=A0A346XXY5_9ACTN|nr:crotonase/enoyl-CoA hydratase family protein [Euzebya pacifica]AXV07082.1 Enoyl-CoA hydratase [Euzebya pacifica]